MLSPCIYTSGLSFARLLLLLVVGAAEIPVYRKRKHMVFRKGGTLGAKKKIEYVDHWQT